MTKKKIRVIDRTVHDKMCFGLTTMLLCADMQKHILLYNDTLCTMKPHTACLCLSHISVQLHSLIMCKQQQQYLGSNNAFALHLETVLTVMPKPLFESNSENANNNTFKESVLRNVAHWFTFCIRCFSIERQ